MAMTAGMLAMGVIIKVVSNCIMPALNFVENAEESKGMITLIYFFECTTESKHRLMNCIKFKAYAS